MGEASHRLPLALTPGEPAGIGPDVTIALALAGELSDTVVFADPALLRSRAAELGATVEIREADAADPEETPPGVLRVVPVALGTPAEPGRLAAGNAGYVLETIRAAVGACRAGDCAALVTGPVHKAVINDAGIAFSGHTEFLAGLGGVERVVMMLAAKVRLYGMLFVKFRAG